MTKLDKKAEAKSVLQSPQYCARIKTIHSQLGIPATYAAECLLPLQSEAVELRPTELDIFERQQQLTPDTLLAWQQMKATAASEGLVLALVSAFRSVDYQEQIFQKKMAAGQLVNDILKVNAAPGYSEHHTGEALDIATNEGKPLAECFDQSKAFQWLCANAQQFGFILSYPRDNPYKIDYEPWHWKFCPDC